MKGCLKIALYAILGFIILAGIASLFKTDDANLTKSAKEGSKEKSEESMPKPSPVQNPEMEFDIKSSRVLPSLLANLDSCYLISSRLSSLSGNDLDNALQQGNMFYNRAYKYFGELQSEANDNLPRDKSKVISNALSVYSEIFNNKYAAVSGFQNQIDKVRDGLKVLVDGISQDENDSDQNIFRVTVPHTSKIEISLPLKGAWCLWEMDGGDRVIMEGTLPKNGYGRFDIRKNQLPIYLSDEKEFVVDNPNSLGPSLQLIFKECEKK